MHDLTKIDKWFLQTIEEIISAEKKINKKSLSSRDFFLNLKKMGFSDQRLAALSSQSEEKIRSLRQKLNIKPVFKRVDTCAGEFETTTAYMYSTYQDECESNPTENKKVVVLGGGPNRIGQGIEFDYCCVHASMAMKEKGMKQ